jgi:hypothetical protein
MSHYLRNWHVPETQVRFLVAPFIGRTDSLFLVRGLNPDMIMTPRYDNSKR